MQQHNITSLNIKYDNFIICGPNKRWLCGLPVNLWVVRLRFEWVELILIKTKKEKNATTWHDGGFFFFIINRICKHAEQPHGGRIEFLLCSSFATTSAKKITFIIFNFTKCADRFYIYIIISYGARLTVGYILIQSKIRLFYALFLHARLD